MIRSKRISKRQLYLQCDRLQRIPGEIGEKRSHLISLPNLKFLFIFLSLSTSKLFLNDHFPRQSLETEPALVMV